MAPLKPRARDLGLPFRGTPGPNNAITDVAGVHVGFTTLSDLENGIRTGVTVIIPRGGDTEPKPVSDAVNLAPLSRSFA
ncbi:MAG: P1 family peptidase [Paracoccaceae bacterium]